MTTAREAPSTWLGTAVVRLLGLLVVAAIVYGVVLLVEHLDVVGG